MVTCSNYFDSSKTVALRTGSQRRKIDFCISISVIQNISVPDKSRKLVSCVRVDYENRTQMLLNPSIQFFIDARGLSFIGRKAMHYAELKFTCFLNRTLFSYANYPREHADVFKTFFY